MQTSTTQAPRLDRTTWHKIRRDYMAGLGSCREFAEKYGTTRYAVQNRCKREEWRLQMAKLDGEVAQETTRIIANRADEILAMRQQVMGQTLEDATFLRGLMMRAIPLMEANDVRALKDLAGIYRIITEQPRKVLGWAVAVRHDATPDATNYVDKNYSPTGQIQFPVITLHTDQDPLLPLFHEEICAQTVGGVSTFGNEY